MRDPFEIPILRRVIFGCLFGGLLLLVGEVVARFVVPPAQPADVMALDADPDLIWTLATDKTHVADFLPNSIGVRGPELLPRTDERRRILTLGDSSVYGSGVIYRDVFSSVVASRNCELGRPTEAIDGGVPGYSSVQALGLYRRMHKVLEPDFVIIATLWSDSRDAMTSDAEQIELIRRRTGAWGAMTMALQRMEGNSSLIRGLRMLLDGSLGRGPRVQKVSWVHADEAGTGPTPPGATERTRVPLSEYRPNLRTLVREVRADGALPMFLLLPHPYDDAGKTLPEVQLAYRAAMRAVATKDGVPLADAAEWFITHPAMEERFWDDIHPNAAGHLAIADVVEATILRDRELAARIGAPSR